MDYPATRRDAVVDTLHGVSVADPYRWLEDVDAKEVQEWMGAQDEVARAYLESLPKREELEKRLIELTYIDAISPPSHRGKRYFYSRSHADKEKAVYYYKVGKDGEERVLIDPNTLSEDGSISVHGMSASHDGRYVAYKLSENNADAATMYVKDLKTGKDSAIDVIPGAKYATASWTPDGKGFYYVGLPTDPSIAPAELPGHAEVRYHRLGTHPEQDRQVQPPLGDPTMFLGTSISEDGRWLLLYKVKGPTTELYFQDLRSKKGRERGFVPLATGFTAQYAADAYEDQLYVTTNEGAPRRRVFRVDPAEPEREHWREIVPEREDAVLSFAYVVGGHLVTDYMVNAHSQLQVRDLEGTLVREVELPGLGSASGLLGRSDEDEAYFYYTSFTQPPMIYETSISTGKTRLWETIDYPVDVSQIEEHQVWYESADGTKVSMFIVHRKGLDRDGSHPTLLTGYGGFNVSRTPGFSPSAALWVEHGGVYAVPNLRGGGEYGEAWHEAGMRDNKQNVFDDFIAAAQYLVDEGYTSPVKLAVSGGSNGGLLVGAVMTQRPELFGAVVCAVPLLDMVRYHRFGSGKTWIPEYGDPEVADDFRFLYAYSPYHHVHDGAHYPALLMLSADSDDRVDPLHARKFVAAIQAASGGGEPAIMRIEQKAGHGGAGTRKKAVAQQVDTYAFLLSELGDG
ncbi:MAG: S9 family peptidase [Myxococcales bacterium]|nr:S9 family peptidase [Myxococcales bacterium]MCB9713292.1 S9 family peptidase [Myxococcales bacterium]